MKDFKARKSDFVISLAGNDSTKKLNVADRSIRVCELEKCFDLDEGFSDRYEKVPAEEFETHQDKRARVVLRSMPIRLASFLVTAALGVPRAFLSV